MRFLYINEGGKRAGVPVCRMFGDFCEDPCMLLTSAAFLKSEHHRADVDLFVDKFADSRHHHTFEQFPTYGEQQYQLAVYTVMFTAF